MRRLLLIPAVALLCCGCAPALRGECKSTKDCPSNAVCTDGLCIAPPVPDGGVGDCQSGCANGYHCANDACVPDQAAQVAITLPAPGVVVGGGEMICEVRASAPGGVKSLALSLGQVAHQSASYEPNDAIWRATLDLSPAAVVSGSYPLVAHMAYDGGAKSLDSAPVQITVDKTGPVIQLEVIYPSRQASTQVFLRTDTVTVDATIKDSPAGVAPDSPRLDVDNVPTVTTVPGQSQGNDVWRFQFPATDVPLAGVTRTVVAEVSATDTVGNIATANASVNLSRLAWTFTAGGPIEAAPALAGGKVFVASNDAASAGGFVYALDPATGAQLWKATLSSPPVGHVAAGAADVYAATAEGRVVKIQESDGSFADNTTCPMPGDQTDLLLRPLTSGVAIAHIDQGSTDEVVFAFTADGYLRMYQPGGQLTVLGSCTVETSLGQGSKTMVPVMIRQGDLYAWVADSKGVVHKVDVKKDAIGDYSLADKTASANSEPIDSPAAVGRISGAPTLLFGLGNGGVLAMKTDESKTWSSTPLSDPILASPAVTDGLGWVLGDHGNAQAFKLSSGASSTQSASGLPVESNGATASPVIAADGRTYLASGSVLEVLAADGSVEWHTDFNLPASSQVDLGTPALGCDGTLFLPVTDGENGSLVALQTDSTTGLARDGWPKAGRDDRNTFNEGWSATATECP